MAGASHWARMATAARLLLVRPLPNPFNNFSWSSMDSVSKGDSRRSVTSRSEPACDRRLRWL